MENFPEVTEQQVDLLVGIAPVGDLVATDVSLPTGENPVYNALPAEMNEYGDCDCFGNQEPIVTVHKGTPLIVNTLLGTYEVEVIITETRATHGSIPTTEITYGKRKKIR